MLVHFMRELGYEILTSFTYVSFHQPRLLTPLILDEHYVKLKNDVIKAERRLLKELGFCVHVQHPHKVKV